MESARQCHSGRLFIASLAKKKERFRTTKKGLENRQYKKYCEDQIDRILNPMGGGEEEAQ